MKTDMSLGNSNRERICLHAGNDAPAWRVRCAVLVVLAACGISSGCQTLNPIDEIKKYTDAAPATSTEEIAANDAGFANV